MKRYIKANTTLETGSYLLSSSGELIPVTLHVPSTTYLSRGIEHLCPTDAEFLLSRDEISEEEALVIYYYCLQEYLGKDSFTLADKIRFNTYCELKYAPKLAKLVANPDSCPVNPADLAPCFDDINEEFYTYCKNNYAKVSVMNNSVEFRITSENNFNWNKVIIDQCILKHDHSMPSNTRYTILRESSKGYKSYFVGATLKEILENDSTILSNTSISRREHNGTIEYIEN